MRVVGAGGHSYARRRSTASKYCLDSKQLLHISRRLLESLGGFCVVRVSLLYTGFYLINGKISYRRNYLWS